MFKNILAAATTTALVLLSLPSDAAPFVHIRAEWQAAPSAVHEWPNGVTISCRGDATGSDSGCGNGASLNQTVAASGTYAVSSTGALVVSNASSATINGFVMLNVWHSAFNPGGPGVGIGIDDASTQGARFQSRVSGPGSFDSHSCSIGMFGQDGAIYSPTACGVFSPDSSLSPLGTELVDFLPGAEIVFEFGIEIAATFTLEDAAGVPEPIGTAMMLLGIGALAFRPSRGSKATRFRKSR